MKLQLRKTTTYISLCLMALGLFVVFAVMLASFNKAAHAQVEGGRLITVYDRGSESAFVTTKETLREAFAEKDITVDARDAVEPSLDEKLVVQDYQVNIYRARPVTVIDGATRQRIVTPYQTAERIVKDAGISLFAEDTTKITRSADYIGDGAGLQLVIDRAAVITVDLYGKKTELRTQAVTVGDMLAEKKIDLGADGRASVALTTPITPGMEIKVWREGKQTVTVEEAVAFETEQVKDADRAIGYKEVKTAGKNGVSSVSYEIEIKNGAEVSRNKIASVVIEAPTKQVEIVGAKKLLNVNYSAERAAIMTAAGVAPSDQDYAAYIINNENALWCPIRWQGTSGCGETYYVKFAGAETSNQVGYGLCQATPGIKMETAGADWRTNVVTQMKWCHQYAMSRYKSWEAAYNAKVSKGWW